MKNYWIIGGLVVLVMSGGVIYTLQRRRHTVVASTESATTFHGENGKTILELLKQRATIETTKDPVLGEFVTSINGLKSGTNGRYWIYSVNGVPTATVPGQYLTTPTETIEWKLE